MLWVFAIESNPRGGVPLFLYENEDGWTPRVTVAREGTQEEMVALAQEISEEERQSVYLFTVEQARAEEAKGWHALAMSATFNNFSPVDILH